MVFLEVVCCPKTAGATNNNAKPQTMANAVNGRSFLISLEFIFEFASSLAYGVCNG
jgi:hypothetical protein